MSNESQGAEHVEALRILSEGAAADAKVCIRADTAQAVLARLAAAEARVAEVEAYIGTLLEGDPDVVRVCEGGGMEEVLSSLAVTMHKTRDRRDRLAAENVAKAREIERLRAYMRCSAERLREADAEEFRADADTIVHEVRDNLIAHAALAPAADASGEVTP